MARHLPAHLTPVIEEIAAATVKMIGELRSASERREKILREQNSELQELRRELARITSTVAELRAQGASSPQPNDLRVVN